jgi:hypothetical protein
MITPNDKEFKEVLDLCYDINKVMNAFDYFKNKKDFKGGYYIWADRHITELKYNIVEVAHNIAIDKPGFPVEWGYVVGISRVSEYGFEIDVPPSNVQYLYRLEDLREHKDDLVKIFKRKERNR